MTTRKTTGDEMTYLSIRLPVDLRAEIERVAAAEDRTVSLEVRRLLKQRVEEFKEAA